MNQKERYLIDIDKAIRIAKEYGKWIPVDKRLPKRIRGENGEYFPSSGYVAVLSDLGNVFITKYNFDFKTWIGRSDHKITHWKPVRNKKLYAENLLILCGFRFLKSFLKKIRITREQVKPV